MADITLQQRKQARDKIAQLATTDPSQAVRDRCAEYVWLWQKGSRGDLFTSLASVALNTANPDSQRIRAIDVIVSLVDDYS